MIQIGYIGYTPSTGNALPGTVASGGVRAVARVLPGGTPSVAREIDICENAKVAAARNSPATAGLQAQCDAARKAGTSTKKIVGGCGEEPTRNPKNPKIFLDVAAGQRYLDCIGAEQIAREKAYYDSVVAKKAGGADGCGPDATTIYDSGGAYTGKALREAWAKCRGVAPGVPASAPAASAPAAPAASSSPPIIPGSPQMVPAGLVSPPSGGGSTSVATFDDFARMTPGGASFPASDPGGPPLPPSLQRDTFGGGAHVEAPAWAWVAGGVVALGLGALFLRSKKVI